MKRGSRNDEIIRISLMYQAVKASVSYSNFGIPIFNKKEKPMFMFTNCIQDLNTSISQNQNIETALNCIIDRLEYCSK